jgi:hypothetical protein
MQSVWITEMTKSETWRELYNERKNTTNFQYPINGIVQGAHFDYGSFTW